MNKQVLVAALLFVLIAQVLADEEFSLSKSYKKCYHKDCPSLTIGCSRVTEISKDRKSLTTTVSCLDGNDRVLKEHITSKDNPFGPSTTFKCSMTALSYVAFSTKHSSDVELNTIEDLA